MVENIKVGIVNGSGGIFCLTESNCYFQGIFGDALASVCDALRLVFTLIIHNDTAFGDADEHGVRSGVVGAIQRGLFDTSPPNFTPTQTRFKAIDFSNTFFYSEYVLVTRSPTPTKTKGISIWALLTHSSGGFRAL